MGNGDKAFDYYISINPSAREELSEVHRCEPYVYAQMIAGKEAVKPGEAKNSWLTGTAAWNYVAISQWILGIRPTYDGLIIDPVIPAAWDGFTVTRQFRGKQLNIQIDNKFHTGKGVGEMTLNGNTIAGSLIPVELLNRPISIVRLGRRLGDSLISNLIEIKGFEGQGYRPLVSLGNGAWLLYGTWTKLHRTTSIQWKGTLPPMKCSYLLQGLVCWHLAVIKRPVDEIQTVVMKIGEVYNIKKDSWHNIILSEDAHVIVVENDDTGDDNTEHCQLTPKLQQLLQQKANSFLISHYQ